MSKTKTTKRRKVWVSSHADGSLGWQAYETRKDAPTDGVAFVEVRPGDVVLSREEMRKIRLLAREVSEGQVLEWRKKPPVVGCTNCGGEGVYSWEDGHNGDEHESPCDCAREPTLKGGDVRRILRGCR